LISSAQSAEEIKERYWQIDNHVVVQGGTFEVAEHLVSVLMASLDDLKGHAVRGEVLELIFQMVAYGPHSEEVQIGNTDLTERCKNRAREGLWDLYRILLDDDENESEAAAIILEAIETDPARLVAFRRARSNNVVAAKS
jgi:hypothetical protein